MQRASRDVKGFHVTLSGLCPTVSKDSADEDKRQEVTSLEELSGEAAPHVGREGRKVGSQGQYLARRVLCTPKTSTSAPDDCVHHVSRYRAADTPGDLKNVLLNCVCAWTFPVDSEVTLCRAGGGGHLLAGTSIRIAIKTSVPLGGNGYFCVMIAEYLRTRLVLPLAGISFGVLH